MKLYHCTTVQMKDERSDRYKINGRLAPLASDNTAGNSVRTKEISRIQGSIKNQNVGTQVLQTSSNARIATG